MTRLKRGPDRVRLPAFVISQAQGLLPAFSPLAGGFDVPPSALNRIFVVKEQDVYEVNNHHGGRIPS
jgi:metallophosphoesterase superfamily enzyme